MKNWIKKVIIGLDLCPFAKLPFEQGLIHLEACSSKKFEVKLKAFIKELNRLELAGPNQISNTLLYFPNGPKKFTTFCDFFSSCQAVLKDLKLQKKYHLVIFHPKFIFKKIDPKLRDHLVNRSPYPCVHILRVSELNAVITHPKMGEMISHKNAKKLEALSKTKLNQYFNYLKK